MAAKALRILGTRGIPAAHGGFETFAEHLAPYLAERGWSVTVYCQEDGAGPVHEDTWHGVRRVHIPVATPAAAGTIVFDWRSTLHAMREAGLVLTLGYNTAVFCAGYRMRGLRNIINMDGVEWRRGKWGPVARAWFWLNDWAGCWLGNHLVADHPEIERHLRSRVAARKVDMIPYGADRLEDADAGLIAPFGIHPDGYAILIARPEPENSILEVTRAWSRKPRGCKLVVLGNYARDHAYQRAVREAAATEVIFPGAIYDKSIVQALRFHARLYVHGHTVGGTNPSLVEAMGAGNPVLAHDNPYNRWVLGEAGAFFRDEATCAARIESLLDDRQRLTAMRAATLTRHSAAFTWDRVLAHYERLLSDWAG